VSVIERTIIGEGTIIKSGTTASPDVFKNKNGEFSIEANILVIPEKAVVR
jgi:ADP-glucose pyrophosphorylase